MSDNHNAKTTRLDIGIWWNSETDHIHMAAKGSFISTVSNDPSSKRYHANLYRKLADALRADGKPHPNPSPEGEGSLS